MLRARYKSKISVVNATQFFVDLNSNRLGNRLVVAKGMAFPTEFLPALSLPGIDFEMELYSLEGTSGLP